MVPATCGPQLSEGRAGPGCKAVVVRYWDSSVHLCLSQAEVKVMV